MRIAFYGKIATVVLILILVLLYFFQPEQIHYSVKGRVAGFSSNPYTILIEHEEMPGYMDAMIMPFQVRDSLELKNLKQGQTIQFEYYVKLKEQKSFVTGIKRIPDSLFKSSGIDSPDFGIYVDGSSNYVQIGDKLPNYTLIDQDGKSFSTNSFLGKKVLLTFIYTSCPVPDYCPLMSQNFKKIYDALEKAGEKNYLLISVSFDLKRDNPQVLTKYGKKYVNNFERWKFVTGAKESIEQITSDFSVLTQVEDSQIIHNLRTVYIDESGEVKKIWPDNYWTPDEVLSSIRK